MCRDRFRRTVPAEARLAVSVAVIVAQVYDSSVHVSKMRRSSVADGQEYAEKTLHVGEIARDCLSFPRLLL